MIRAIAATLLIIGNVLVVAAIFVPWLVLTTTFANSFGTGGLSPWTGIVGGAGQEPHLLSGFLPFGLFYLVLALGSVGYSLVLLLALIARDRSANWGAAFGFAIGVLALAGFMLVGVTSGMLQEGLAFVYPYFVVRMGTGAEIALLGALGVLLGAVLSRNRAESMTLAHSEGR